jgi:hypothetical protein
MGSLIDDQMVDAFAVVAPVDEVAGTLRSRCGGAIDRVLPGFPATMSETTIAAVLQHSRHTGCVRTIPPRYSPTRGHMLTSPNCMRRWLICAPTLR